MLQVNKIWYAQLTVFHTYQSTSKTVNLFNSDAGKYMNNVYGHLPWLIISTYTPFSLIYLNFF